MRQPKHTEKILFQCHFFYHKVHVDLSRIEPGPPRWEVDEKPPKTWQKKRDGTCPVVLNLDQKDQRFWAMYVVLCAECWGILGRWKSMQNTQKKKLCMHRTFLRTLLCKWLLGSLVSPGSNKYLISQCSYTAIYTCRMWCTVLVVCKARCCFVLLCNPDDYILCTIL